MTELPAGDPVVSVLLPVLDEGPRIDDCLDAILAAEYPRDRLEVLVVDGGSADDTRERAARRAGADPRVRVLDNPRRTAPAGLNVGLAEARGEVVLRMDARALPERGYVRTCVDLLRTSGAANVGGPQRAVGEGLIGRAAAVAMTSRFGVGDARFRFTERDAWVDTVWLGAWLRQTLEELGGFDERFSVNQDYELNYRIRRSGGRVLVSPRIRAAYRVRESLHGIARQYFRYGKGKAAALRVHPESVRWRQLAAPLLAATLAGSAAVAPARPRWGALVPALYAGATVAASVAAGRRAGRSAVALPVVYAAMHLGWGIGFWTEALRAGPTGPFLVSLVRSTRARG